MWYTDDLVKLY